MYLLDMKHHEVLHRKKGLGCKRSFVVSLLLALTRFLDFQIITRRGRGGIECAPLPA